MTPPTAQTLIEAATRLLEPAFGPPLAVLDISEDDLPPQGYSGAEVRVYRVTFQAGAAAAQTTRIVTKQAMPLEQRILRLLAEQGQAVPSLYLPAPDDTQRATVYMRYAEPRPPHLVMGDPYAPLTRQVAQRLAAIHAANRTQCPVWLPRASADPLGELYLSATHQEWDRCLQDNAFAAEFGGYTARLQRALAAFLGLLREFEAEGETLTLISTDLHPDHIRLLDGGPVFIDWEQACYGPFYLDLVNYFTVETALLYRDALADCGYAVPAAAFMERFREAGHYMGLRYLEVGLQAWQAGGDAWQRGRWFFHYCLTLALQGR